MGQSLRSLEPALLSREHLHLLLALDRNDRVIRPLEMSV
jgi:hypothetical protein